MRILISGLGLALIAPTLALACPEVSVRVTEVNISAADISGAYHEAPVVAAGDQDLSQCGYAAGFVITRPDFSFHLADISGPLAIAVNGTCDTVLLVNDPSGNWWTCSPTWRSR